MARDDAPEKSDERKAPPRPEANLTADGRYLIGWPSDNIRFLIERVHRRAHGELWGFITVQVRRGDETETLVRQGRINFQSWTAPEQFNRRLKAMIGAYQWDVRLGQATEEVVRLQVEANPYVDSALIPDPPASLYLLHPFLEHNQPTILFGDYQSMKSWVATAIAFHLAGLPVFPDIPIAEPINVAYNDWEADEATFRRRRDQLIAGARGAQPQATVYYRRLVMPFTEVAEDVREFTVKNKIGLNVGDSVVMASGGVVREEEAAVALYSAARTIGTTLWISHIAQDLADNPNRKPRALGIGTWMSQARLGWLAEKEQVEGESTATVTIHHAKYNNDGRQRARAYTVNFADGQVSFNRADATSTESHDRRASPHERIRTLLRTEGAMTAAEVAEALKGSPGPMISEQNASNILRRYRDKTFVRIGGARPYRWGLSSSKQDQGVFINSEDVANKHDGGGTKVPTPPDRLHAQPVGQDGDGVTEKEPF